MARLVYLTSGLDSAGVARRRELRANPAARDPDLQDGLPRACAEITGVEPR